MRAPVEAFLTASSMLLQSPPPSLDTTQTDFGSVGGFSTATGDMAGLRGAGFRVGGFAGVFAGGAGFGLRSSSETPFFLGAALTRAAEAANTRRQMIPGRKQR